MTHNDSNRRSTKPFMGWTTANPKINKDKNRDEEFDEIYRSAAAKLIIPTSFNPRTTIRAAILTVPKEKTHYFPPGTKRVELGSLVLKFGSNIRIPDMGSGETFTLIVGQTTIDGTGPIGRQQNMILMFGSFTGGMAASGSNGRGGSTSGRKSGSGGTGGRGAKGKKGGNLNIDFGDLTILNPSNVGTGGVQIRIYGGSAQQGGYGGDGGKGKDARCTGKGAGAGGDGGKGGNGGPGGDGGTLTVKASLSAPYDLSIFDFSAVGKQGGMKAPGGRRGKGGAGKSCGFYGRRSGKNGKAGDWGARGPTGKVGTVIIHLS